MNGQTRKPNQKKHEKKIKIKSNKNDVAAAPLMGEESAVFSHRYSHRKESFEKIYIYIYIEEEKNMKKKKATVDFQVQSTCAFVGRPVRYRRSAYEIKSGFFFVVVVVVCLFVKFFFFK